MVYFSLTIISATDPVVQKVAIYGAYFYAHLKDVYLHFPALFKQTSFVDFI
jgi:hypothetical protein